MAPSTRSERQATQPLTITIDDVMPGAAVVHAGEHQLALGFPEEVVKAWMQANVGPTAWLIPDLRTHDGIVQWALEFPLYFALFIQGAFARGEKVVVLVRRDDWPDVVEYLRLTLLGLTREELTREGVAPALIEALVREGEHLALKRPDGAVAQIEDFLAPRFFDVEGTVELSGLRVKAHGDNTYSFYTSDDRLEEYKLQVPAGTEQSPPYAAPLAPGKVPVAPQPLELITLGATNGFDPAGPCSNMLVQANGRFLLVDAGPYIRSLLSHSGVSINQINAVVITHAHEDHAVGLSALLGLTRRLRLFISRENAAILGRKLAILNPGVSNPATLLADAFDLVLVEPERDYDFLGLQLRFHYTMHSIPCTGVQLAMRDGGAWRRVLIVGDNNSRENIEQAARDGVIAPERLERLRALYAWDGDLLIADAGAGLIHGAAEDFAGSGAETVVCVHTPALDDRARHRFTLAQPGFRYTVIPERRRPTPLERGMAHKALLEAFGGAMGEADDALGMEWIDAMLDAAAPLSVNRGQIVVRQGEPTRDLFVALTGELSVEVAPAESGPAVRVASIHAGELFGEMAAVSDASRTATVRAETPSRLMRVPGEVFFRFASEAGLLRRLPELWSKRGDLEGAGILAGASVTTRNQFARHAVRRSIAPGSTLIREGSRSSTVFVLVAGRVQVYKGSDPLLVDGAPIIVDPGALLGETAPFLRKARNASIVTVDACEVLAIRGSDFKRIIQRSPHLFFNISRVVAQRAAA